MYTYHIYTIDQCTPTNARHTCARTSNGRARGYTLARRASESVGLAVATLEHGMRNAHTNKRSHKPLTYIQQTVNIITKEQVYPYANLLLGVRVCPGGVPVNAWVSLRLTFVGGCVTGGR